MGNGMRAGKERDWSQEWDVGIQWSETEKGTGAEWGWADTGCGGWEMGCSVERTFWGRVWMGDGMGTVTKRGTAWYVGGEGSWGWDWKGDER